MGDIQIPVEIQLSATLKKGRIYWIEGKWPYPDGDGRGHFFIVLNNDPRSNSVLILTHGSRGVDKARYSIALAEQDIRTLVDIQAGKYEIWKEDTVINCNDVQQATLKKLAEVMRSGELEVQEVELDQEDLDAIIAGVLLSDVVPEVHKAPLRA